MCVAASDHFDVRLLTLCGGCWPGLEYLHNNCIIHGDVKPANILLTSKTVVAKVVHFGFANFSCERDTTLQLHNADAKGTDGYLDPE